LKGNNIDENTIEALKEKLKEKINAAHWQ